MKTIIKSALAALVLISCSDNDSAVTENNNIIIGTELDEVKIFANGPGGDYQLLKFEGTKIQNDTYFNDAGEAEYTYSYIYNQNGDVEGLTGTREGETIFERSVTYDNEGRISSKNDTYYNNPNNTSTFENYSYTYNDDNTVTVAISASNEQPQTRIYYFDNEGKVFKIVSSDGSFQNVVYTGAELTKLNDVLYAYDEAKPVTGEFHNMYRNQFSTYSNFILYTGYIVVWPNNYYIASRSNNLGQLTNYEYVFRNDGYPLSLSVSDPGSNTLLYVISYK